jgi:hypothetical protein
MTTMSGRRTPSRSEYQENGMPPGMGKFELTQSASDETIAVITWADSTPWEVAATLDAQRFLSELFPAGTRWTSVTNLDSGVATRLGT